MTYRDPPQNPFSTTTDDNEPSTKPLDEIIRRAVDVGIMLSHFAFPAKIVAISSDQTVDVQHCIQALYKNGDPLVLPVIQKIPVIMPMGADYSIRLPIAVGDTGYCLVADRSLDVWLASEGGVVDPSDSRVHDLVDAVFIPGLAPTSKQLSVGGTDMVLKNGACKVTLQKDGTFKTESVVAKITAKPGGTFRIENADNELIDLLDQITSKVKLLSDTLKVDTVNTIFGPMKLNSFAIYTQISTDLQALITKLETLKG